VTHPPGTGGQEIDADPFAPAHVAVRELRAEAAEKAADEVVRRSFWRELPVLVLVALVVAIVIKTFLFQAFYIPSSSMEDTLEVNDRVMVNKLAYRIGDLRRGDVVVFDDPRGSDDGDGGIIGSLLRNVAESIGLSTPRSEFIKRVVGLPGESVEVRDGVVYVDGEPIDEPYRRQDWSRRDDFGPTTVPDDSVFVMGDNRDSSQDSRSFGAIPVDSIVGRAFVTLWPPAHWSGL
jgi:signal peptidase I